SAVLILLENPYYLYDAAFQLSFGAVIGIGLLCPVLEELLNLHKKYAEDHGAEKQIMKKLRKGILQGISVSIAAQLATLPVIMWNFYQISCYGLIANLLIIPPMGILLATGIAAGFFGNAANHMSPLFYNITDVILKISYLILIAYEKISELCGSMPGNLWITGKPAFFQTAAYYILLFMGLILYWRHKQKERTESRKRRPVFIKIGVFFGIAVFILSFRRSADFELHALSVGQGDCFLIKGRNTPVIMMDGGSSDEKEAGKYRILPCLKANAVNRIDYVFLSHMDSDHVNGVMEILADEDCGISISRVILPKTAALLEADDNYTMLITLAEQRNVPVYLMEAGEKIEQEGLRITCLSPSVSESEAWRTRDSNENSLVLKTEYLPAGFRALFTGDIGTEAERELLAQLEPVHYLKVAHHGSRNSTSEAFLKKAAPRIAVISAGEGNSYGHPHEETTQRLNNIITYVTFRDGQISLKINRKRVTIDTFLNE
ncbi:MAG: ComEC/Rec2 family competence protein, partial [Lachnospiraceae bacterium]